MNWRVLLGVFFVLAMAVVPSDARAATVACGDVVTQSATLSASLRGCTAGLVIGASDVTIDLNGHSIEGTGRDTALGSGIEATGVSRVTVKNGRISGFERGVSFRATEGSRIEGLTISDTIVGIQVVDQPLIAPQRAVVVANFVTRSRAGISIFGAADVVGNTITDISALGAPFVQTSPVGVGIFCRDGGPTLIQGNYVARTTYIGINLFFCGSDLIANTAADNGLGGILRERSPGLTQRNRANGNGGTGITTSDSHGLLIENVTNANAGDGINVNDQVPQHGAFHTLTDNVANANGRFGIFTRLAGVIDGGKNRANANGEPAQCLGVVCR